MNLIVGSTIGSPRNGRFVFGRKRRRNGRRKVLNWYGLYGGRYYLFWVFDIGAKKSPRNRLDWVRDALARRDGFKEAVS